MNMNNNVLNNQNQFMKFNNGYNNINNFMNFNNNNNFNNFPNNNMNNFGFMNNINNNNFGGFNNLWMNQFNNINNLNWKMNNINLNNNDNMNLNINNNQINSNLIKVYFIRPNGFGNYENFEIISSLEEKVSTLIDKYRKIANDYEESLIFVFNAKRLNNDLTLSEAGVSDGMYINVVNNKDIKGGGPWFDKEINIKFIKISKFYNYQNNNPGLIGLLKLCLLKEISQKISDDKLKLLPDFISVIIKILSIGYIATPNEVEKNIREVLEKLRGSNIINFSNYFDEIIDSNQINQILSLLSKNDFKEMNNTRYLLSKYNKYVKLFNKEFEISKKESIFEFSLISLVVIEREDFERFEKEREKCPHRVD